MKHLKPFFEYYRNTRGNEISKDEFLSILNTNCKDWLKAPHQLVRRKEKYDSQFSLIDPSKDTRISINPSNHVTMLMDDLPSWKNFPKRSKSVIFSVNVEGPRYSPAFGNEVYFVIPFDNARFGVTPELDLWSARVRKSSSYSNDSSWFFKEMSMNDDLSNYFYNINVSSDYNLFSKQVNEFFAKEIDVNVDSRITRRFKEDFKETGKETFIDYLNDLLSPGNFWDKDHDRINDNGYKVMDYNQMINNPTKRGNECWTDSKCLIYYAGNSDLNVNHVDELYKEMLKELGI